MRPETKPMYCCARPASGVASCTASLAVDVPAAGMYVPLVRYEAVYRFNTFFRLKVEQNGTTVFDAIYGGRDQPKVQPATIVYCSG